MSEERKGLYKGMAVATLFFILIFSIAYFYVDNKYIEPLKKTGLI